MENEESLLGQFVSKVNEYDPDVIVGHDLYTRVLGLISTRMDNLKLRSVIKLGRL